MQRHEMAVAAEQMSQQQQHEKELELERSQRQRGYDGPTIGWYRKTDYFADSDINRSGPLSSVESGCHWVTLPVGNPGIWAISCGTAGHVVSG